MRFSVLDLLFACCASSIGMAVFPSLHAIFPDFRSIIVDVLMCTLAYLLITHPIYKIFRLPPMLLPRCPCCNSPQPGFHYWGTWPRATFRCPTCHGEFIVYLNGKLAPDEPWDKPVLALKWPYAFGRYKRMKRPNQPTTNH